MTDRGAHNGRAIRISGKLVRVLALACAVGLMGLTTALATTSKTRTRTPVRSRNTKLGRVIVFGFTLHTLYGFSKDGKDKSACDQKCSRTWIPLSAIGTVVTPSSHVNGHELGKFRRKNGSWQVTYYGQPLYLYKGDTKPGQTKGHYKYQFGGSWYAIDVNGSPAPPPGY